MANNKILLTVARDGKFNGSLTLQEKGLRPHIIACMFAGTDLLTSAASRPISVDRLMKTKAAV